MKTSQIQLTALALVFPGSWPVPVSTVLSWMDTYAQRAGTFSAKEDQELERLRRAWAELLIDPAGRQTAAKKAE